MRILPASFRRSSGASAQQHAHGKASKKACASTESKSAPSPRKEPLDIVEQPQEISCHSEDAFLAHSAYLMLRTIRRKLEQSAYSKVVVGLSGGTTPMPIYTSVRLLALSAAQEDLRKAAEAAHAAESPNARDRQTTLEAIDWSRVYFFLVDERFVPPNHPDSNQRMIRQHLLGEAQQQSEQLQHGDRELQQPADVLGIPEKNLIFPDTTLPLGQCLEKYGADLLNLFERSQQIDLVTLGIGSDAHIASIFPPISQQQLQQLQAPTSIVMHSTTNKFAVEDRITVSLHVICSAKQKIFFLNGSEKVKLWRQMQELEHAGEIAQYPALAVLRTGGVRVVATPPLDEVDGHSTLQRQCEFLSIVILGASGDLAKKKTYPALFSLFCEGLLPKNFHIIGYARTKMPFEAFWEKILPGMQPLSSFFCRKSSTTPGSKDLLSRFKEHCSYLDGQYGEPEDFARLNEMLKRAEGTEESVGRILYLALPPQVFIPSIENFGKTCRKDSGWTRVIVEKPFGKDLQTSDRLSSQLTSLLQEKEIFRMDHYLGKEMALSLTALRFANVAFMPLFHRNYVKSVRITFKEEGGTWGRGGYFDEYGIIRDVMQNHMIQLLTLIAMDRPASLQDDDVRDEKVKVLKQIPCVKLSDTILGQFVRSEDGEQPGYTEDETVPRGSLTPTFCTTVLWINNERWCDVPFVLKAGKALESKKTEVRVQLREAPAASTFFGESITANELVIQVQPREAVYLKIYTKKPGLSKGLQATELDLSVVDRFDVDRLPDAYERLILDVIKGNKENFVRTDELREAWRVFTPLLHEIEKKKLKPLPYPAASSGPKEAYDLIQKFYSYKETDYHWTPPTIKKETSN